MMKNKYIPKTIQFNSPLDVDTVNEFFKSESTSIWDEYFKFIRWASKRNQLNSCHTYMQVKCSDGAVVEMMYKPDELKLSFDISLKFFEKEEDYEMCQYIVDLRKWIIDNKLTKYEI